MVATKLIPAVGYIRMSSVEQKDSPDRQRGLIQQWCKQNRRKIVAWYSDEGVSGWKKRGDFDRMIADCESPNCKFKEIIVDEQSRFARFKPLKTLAYLSRLEESGVGLVTVDKGPRDWNDIAGVLLAAVDAVQDHQESRTKGRRSLTGRINKASQGPRYSLVPYGYSPVLIAPSGEQTRLDYGQKHRTPDGWKKTIEPSNDERSDAMLWAFEQVRERRVSPAQLVEELRAQDVPAPLHGTSRKRKRLEWNRNTLWRMLTNRVYCGDCVMFRHRQGAFYTVGDDGSIIEADGVEHYCEDGAFVFENAHTPIVPRKLFNEVQMILGKRRYRGAKEKHGRALLAGVVKCGHCGQNLSQSHDGYSMYYVCPAKTGGLQCKTYRAKQDSLNEQILARAIDGVLGNRRIVRQIQQMLNNTTSSDDAELVRRRLAELDGKIARATERLILVDDAQLSTAQNILQGLRGQKERLTAQLAAAQEPVLDDREVLEVQRALKELRDTYESGAADLLSDTLANFLRHAIDRVLVFWEKPPSEHRRVVSRVEMHVPSEDGVIVVELDAQPFNRVRPALIASEIVTELYDGEPVTAAAVGKRMGCGTSTTFYRLKAARRAGLVENQGRKGWIPVHSD